MERNEVTGETPVTGETAGTGEEMESTGETPGTGGTAGTGETVGAGGSGAARLQQRLQKRHQARIEDLERRKEDRERRTVTEEQVQYFSGTFHTEMKDVQLLLDSCCGAPRTLVLHNLEEASTRTGALQKFLNDSLMFLTQYEVRHAQEALQHLQSSITITREHALPKKKFTFTARTKAKVPADGAPPPAASPAGGGVSVVDGAPAGGGVSVVGGAPAGGGVSVVGGACEQCGFSNIRDDFLSKTAEELQQQDVLLTDLSNCRVRLPGSPSTLHLKNIEGCEILCGPVSSSVFVDGCRNSVLAFPCQQLRTHNSSDCQVYLHVTSRAIIEDCRGLSFAPFSWSYPTLDRDFAVSGLDRQRNNWREVDDFNWLAAGTPSPNWTVLPEADRKTDWDSELNL